MIRNLAPMLDGLAAVGGAFPSLCAERHQRSRHRGGRAGALRRPRRHMARPHRRHLSAARGQYRLQGRQHPRLLPALRRRATISPSRSMPTASFRRSAVLRMVRIMQASPEIGILQGLVVGMPSTSAFARIFQFGMRLAMWSYTTGSAWWQADCGPHWGHNSVLRLKPFTAHCHIPPLPEGGPLGGHILSHDQIEAVLMRRAGYEVRVLPEEHLGWEENPPTLLEFIRRDIRWCQGNMQYWHFLDLPGLKFVSRYQLAFAILMFLGSPAWMALLVLGTFGVVTRRAPVGLHRARPRPRGPRHRARHVVRAQDRDRDRCADARRRRAGATAAAALFLVNVADRDRVLPDAVADHVVRPHGVPGDAGVRRQRRLGRPGARRSRRAARARARQAVAADGCSAGRASSRSRWRRRSPSRTRC